MSGVNGFLKNKEPDQRFWDSWSFNSLWREKLARKASHKALGIAEDDMNISTSTGMGWKELAVIAAMIAGTGYGVSQFTGNESSPQQPPPAAAPAMPGDAGYDVLFYDQDGNPMQLDRWPGSVPK